MTSENESKRVLVSAELYSLAYELNSLAVSDGEIYRESLSEVFLPPIVTNSDGTISALNGDSESISDFLQKYGFPSIFHPVCCSVKCVV